MTNILRSGDSYNLLVSSVASQGDEMIQNGDFSAGSTHYHFIGDTSHSVTAGVLKIVVPTTGGLADCFFGQVTPVGVAGTYRLSFDARASAARTIQLGVQYLQPVVLTTTMTHYDIDFPGVSGPSPSEQTNFAFGANIGFDFYIDNISLRRRKTRFNVGNCEARMTL